jgi:hypothetical protein
MVAITEKGRRLVEKRAGERRGVLLPLRVSVDGRAVFEGATLDVSASGVYFRLAGCEDLSAGQRVRVEICVPAEFTGGPLGYRESRAATVVRVENETFAAQVGCRPRARGVALAFDPASSQMNRDYAVTSPALAVA